MTKCSIPISEFKFLSSLVKGYLAGSSDLKKLYTFPPNEQGLIESIDSKALNYTKFTVLSKVVDCNYPNSRIKTEKEKENLLHLKQEALCVTTAHQPNLFLGPLYILTKAISTIALANHLNKIQSKRQIVPVFIIGSEDHDKEELLNVTLFGKRYEWMTTQIGSIGAMVVDDSLEAVLEEFLLKFGNSENAARLKSIFMESYYPGATLAQGFGGVLRRLLGPYGLIVLDINIPEVKAEMKSIFKKEIETSFSSHVMRDTIDFLTENYTVQANPTEINLFEYQNGARVKIKSKSKELIERVVASPESFSPSVILRPLMQQMMVPSVVNIGGGAEVAYWLQLKGIFDAEHIDFPVLLLRDIYSVLDQKSWAKWREYGLDEYDFFLTNDELKRKLILSSGGIEDEKRVHLEAIERIFKQLEKEIIGIDKTLGATVLAEKSKSIKSLELIYEKALKSLKRNDEARLLSMEKIKNRVFVNQNLTERIENFSSSYILYGDAWIEDMIQNHNSLQNLWTLDIR